MFQRFTERARRVVIFGQEEARGLRHNYIGTEHLLLGVLREGEGVGARVLASLGVTLDAVRAEVVSNVGQGDAAAVETIPFTPRAKRVLELSLREALSLGHDYIGTEHLLLGLVREQEGVAAKILLHLDADAETVRERTFELLGTKPTPDYERSMEGARSSGGLWWSLAAAVPIVVGAFVFGAGLAVGWLIWG
jgi:ATP-dependent Clp protease ATP-binding subunit ClpC